VDENSVIYWTHMERYENCGQQFLWHHGWGGIDLGNGPGKRKTKPQQSSEHNAIAGTVVQHAIEMMYNNELYRDPLNLPTQLEALVEREWVREEKRPRRFVDYSDARESRSKMIADGRDAVRGYVQTMKAHRFLGPYARAEVRLLGQVNKWVTVGGIADVVVRRADTGVTIIDGKYTRHKMRFVDMDQLRWYALAFFLMYKQMPDRLAFVWYRFPHGTETPDDDGNLTKETGVEWVPFTREDLQGLAVRAVDARDGMREEKFEPNPVPTYCNFCDFELVCPERQAQRNKNSANRTPSQVEGIAGDGGFSDFGM